ncbi:MAG: hypothetical protein Q9201_002613 [Fulgogasparrea decipioides]
MAEGQAIGTALTHGHQPPEHVNDLDLLPLLPRLPSFQSSSRSSRVLEDEGIGNSSDTPLFSSDDMPASSENYFEHRMKRQRRGPWWVRRSEKSIPVPQRKPKREFKRNVDSGVWMGSDSDIVDELDHLESDDASHSESLCASALRTVEDPGMFEGPVFPYWEDQPKDLKAFWYLQRIAARKVNTCVNEEAEVVDLSDLGLSKLQDFTLEPLRLFVTTRRISHPDALSQCFESFIPNLQLFLANNKLLQLPGQLFKLQNLTVLSLRGNNLSGIPSAIGNLVNLRELNLANNNLRWLPYEIRELLHRNLKIIMLHPNPFLRPMPRPAGAKSAVSPMCSTAPAYLSIDGTLTRGSPFTPTTTTDYWPQPAFRTKIDPTRPDRLNKAPSLFETSLRACRDFPQLSQLPFLVPPDAPESLVPALKHTWRVKQQGGQRCTICNASYIIPRTEWIEWWQLSVKPHKPRSRTGSRGEIRYDPTLESVSPGTDLIFTGAPVPLIRRGCSWACVPERGEEEGTRCGWSPAKDKIGDFY